MMGIYIYIYVTEDCLAVATCDLVVSRSGKVKADHTWST